MRRPVLLSPRRAAALFWLCAGASCHSPSGAASTPADAANDAAPVDAGDPLEAFAPFQAPGLPYRCELGIAPPDAEPSFVPLLAGGMVPIAGVGQAGLTARPAVRLVADAPVMLDEATIQLVLTNIDSGVPAESRPFDRPVELDCRDDGACYYGPVLVEISHLARLPELEGLVVGISVELLDDAGSALCRSRSHGVLDRW